jgi:hypothetical protein
MTRKGKKASKPKGKISKEAPKKSKQTKGKKAKARERRGPIRVGGAFVDPFPGDPFELPKKKKKPGQA